MTYLQSLKMAEEMWEWLCDNPGKQKYHWPKYDSLMADSSEECSVCDYRLKKHDGHFFCNGKSYLSIEPCFLSAICLEYQEKFVSCYCIDAKIEYAEKVYFAILDERLKNM
jgi:hypothetical protein